MITKLKSQFPSLFLRPILLEDFIVLLKQCRRVNTVGALAAALVAVLALLDEFHLLGPFFSEVDTIWSAFQEKAHSGAVLDFDSNRAGLAIAAATAELT